MVVVGRVCLTDCRILDEEFLPGPATSSCSVSRIALELRCWGDAALTVFTQGAQLIAQASREGVIALTMTELSNGVVG